MTSKYVALLAFLVACTPHPHSPSTPSRVVYTIVINSGDFTEKQMLAIAGGASDWENATYGLQVDVQIAPCARYDESTNTYCVVAQHGEDMVCGVPVVGCSDRPMHRLALDRWLLSLKELRLVAAHEIGHAMGLAHDRTGNAMASSVERQTPPTCRDVRAFWWLHHELGQCRNAKVYGP